VSQQPVLPGNRFLKVDFCGFRAKKAESFKIFIAHLRILCIFVE